MGTKATIQHNAHDKEACRHYHLKLNKETDAKLIEMLDAQENMQGYIKALIRADIAASGAETVSNEKEDPANE